MKTCVCCSATLGRPWGKEEVRRDRGYLSLGTVLKQTEAFGEWLSLVCEVEARNENLSRGNSMAKSLSSVHLISVYYWILINTVSLYPESINEVTFGAGVSYIGTPATLHFTKGKFWVFLSQVIHCL